jgi:hypothetical protein
MPRQRQFYRQQDANVNNHQQPQKRNYIQVVNRSSRASSHNQALQEYYNHLFEPGCLVRPRFFNKCLSIMNGPQQQQLLPPNRSFASTNAAPSRINRFVEPSTQNQSEVSWYSIDSTGQNLNRSMPMPQFSTQQQQQFTRGGNRDVSMYEDEDDEYEEPSPSRRKPKQTSKKRKIVYPSDNDEEDDSDD